MPAAYPNTLPCPQYLRSTSAERRLLSDQPAQQARAISLERLAVESVSWTLTDLQAAIFADWYDIELDAGGAWFTATWPTPQGRLVTQWHRFTDAPLRWDFIPGGFWTVAGECEVQPRPISGP